MSLENKSLEEIKEAALLSLIKNQVSEKKTLDYKRDPIGGTDGDKKEFLADVSSFANMSGGHLIIGMAEDNGIPTELCGIGVSDPDAEINRLENIIRDGISPRIQGISISPPVTVSSNGNIALVIRIPKSWSLPHMVSFRGSSKFYSRNSAGKFPLDVDEIRSAFVLSETVADRIREFRVDRIGKVLSDDTPASVSIGAKAVLHLIPLNSFASRARFDLEILLRGNAADIHASLQPTSFPNFRRNIDGILVHDTPTWTNRASNYVQFFYNGCVEYVEWLSPADSKTIPIVKFEGQQIRMLQGLLKLYNILTVEPPVFVMLCVLNVRDFMIDIPDHAISGDVYPIDRDHLIIPEILLESGSVDAGAVLKPLFDSVWNAGGCEGSPNYSASGNWILG